MPEVSTRYGICLQLFARLWSEPNNWNPSQIWSILRKNASNAPSATIILPPVDHVVIVFDSYKIPWLNLQTRPPPHIPDLPPSYRVSSNYQHIGFWGAMCSCYLKTQSDKCAQISILHPVNCDDSIGCSQAPRQSQAGAYRDKSRWRTLTVYKRVIARLSLWQKLRGVAV